MEGQNGMLGVARKPCNSLLNLMSWSARSIHGESHRRTPLQGSDEAHGSFYGSSRRRTTAAAVTKAMNDVSDVFAIFIFTCKDYDAAIAPEVCSSKNPTMPERVNDGSSVLCQRFVMFVSVNFPAPGPRE